MIANKFSSLPPVEPFSTDIPHIYTPVEKNKYFGSIQNGTQAEIIQGYKFQASKNIKDIAINISNKEYIAVIF